MTPENSDKNKDVEAVRRFLPKGGDIAGAAVAGSLSFLAVDPVAAAAAGSAGPLLAATLAGLADVSKRLLSDREEQRVAGVGALVIEGIRNRLESGDEPRNDDFFRFRLGKRPDAEELLEGVLLKARSQYEERKLAAYSNFMGAICFTKDVSAEQANILLEIIDRTSFHGFEILHAFHVMGSYSPWQWHMVPRLETYFPAIALGMQELANNHLLQTGTWGDMFVKITPLGAQLAELTNIKDIVDHSFEPTGRVLLDCAINV